MPSSKPKRRADPKREETKTLRDEYAMAALTGIMASPNNDNSVEDSARTALDVADALMNLRSRLPEAVGEASEGGETP